MQTEVRQGRLVGLLLHLEPLPEIHVNTQIFCGNLYKVAHHLLVLFSVCVCFCALTESYAEMGVM